MEFEEFAERAAEVESASADSEVVALVADLLAGAGGELPVVARFVQGRIFPAWRSETLDVGPALCYEAVARAAATEVSAADVEDRVAETGDVGAAAAGFDFGGQRGLAAFGGGGGADSLTVAEVAAEFERIAEADGAGSEDRKRDALFGLFNRCSPAEARYLARLVLGEMRIGVGEGSVRDAVAEAFEVPVEAVARALQVSNDYGEVAAVAREEGVEGLDAMDLTVGRPVQAMLAQAGTVAEATEAWDAVATEVKYDGARCISGYTPVYVKNKGATVVRDIERGDEVLTHRGDFKPVVAKNKRRIDSDERVFRFSSYLGEDFKITEGHELLVHREGRTEWIPVEEVGEDDWLTFPIPDIEVDVPFSDCLELETTGNYSKEFKLDDRFFRFLGYWVGDGTSNRYNGNRRLGLQFNNDDHRRMDEYRRIIESTLGISPESIHEYDHGGATELYWTDRPLLEWLSENFRKQEQDGWRDKRVPEWFWGISESQYTAFFQGWFEADGHEDDRGRRSVVTKERDLASTIQLIGLGHGRVMGFSRRRVDGSTYYELTPTKSDRDARIEAGQLVVRILKKEELSRSSPREVDPRQRVYNLQVEEDQSFCVPLLAMHNCQIHHDGDDVRVYSRNMEDVTDALPEIVEFVEAECAAPAILDGEVVAVDDDGAPLPFQEVLRRFRRKHDVDRMREEVAVELRAFDCLHAPGDGGDGEDLLDAPLTERRERLAATLDGGLSGFEVADDGETIERVEREALAAGHEGIMLKNPDSQYTPGRRGKNWLKRKPDVETLDLVVTGAEWGEGRRANLLGTYLLSARTPDGFETVGKVATGVTDEQLEELHERLQPHVRGEDGKEVDVAPAVVFEVGYEEIQPSPTYESGYALRFPRFESVRTDKDPEDADTVERVERLADRQ